MAECIAEIPKLTTSTEYRRTTKKIRYTHTIIRFRHGIFVVYVFFFEVEGKSEFHLAKWTCQLFDEDFFMNNVVKSNEDFKLDVAPIFLQFSSRSPPAATNWIEQFY